MTDKDIVQRIITGDRQAGTELVHRYAGRAFGLAMQMLRNREDAEEAVQDAFLRAFRSVERFEWKSTFATWFYRIVYNVCVSLAQSRGRENRHNIDEESTIECAALPDSLPDRIAEDAEFDLIVRNEIEKMQEDYAMILTLFILNEQSYDEIVAITGLPLGTVKNRLFRGRLRLREAVLSRYRVPTPLMSDAG